MAYYWSAVVRPYKAKLEGWPSDIPFGNLSDVATSLPTLEKLSRLLKNGQLHWKALTDTELEELEDKRNEQIEAGQIVERVRQPRSDKGKKHLQNVTGAKRNKRRAGGAVTRSLPMIVIRRMMETRSLRMMGSSYAFNTPCLFHTNVLISCSLLN